ncbi:MAG: hypothetical protein PWQ63_609 [Methanolobus sp.]|jgi:hypothetical protein|nr:hypothetical protein [Methanolobus sp.]MDK2947449.1 hypothetical protein [Methanolobus sp.]
MRLEPKYLSLITEGYNMGKMIYFSDDEIEFFNQLIFRIDQGGGMAWIEELVQKDKNEVYMNLCKKIRC